MNVFAKEVTTDPFAYESLGQLSNDCVEFYNKNLREITNASETLVKRQALAKWIKKFHQDCGTITSEVEKAIGTLEDTPCLLLMTAHQPNLFAYSGVLRKATLTQVLAGSLSERLHIPVVCFFGIADQDFSDDRWVNSAVLPDVKRRNGILELHANLPKKIILNKIQKPSRQVIDGWQKQIESWFNQKFDSVQRSCRDLGIAFGTQKTLLTKNFEDFWEIVEDAYLKANNYADFNAFVMSEIVNNVWGYSTVFSRFSECQRIFEEEFSFLLSHSEEYSRYVKEATTNKGNTKKGVYESEYETIPFWCHCDCGSKARLIADLQDEHLIGRGKCLRCKREYELDFGLKKEPKISGILSKVSARSLSMPLIFFSGLEVGCYVGGVGGKQYLHQATIVARNMGMPFPPIAIWRPKDFYFGVGQLEALLIFRKLSSSFDLSQLPALKTALEVKITIVQEHIDRLKHRKKEFAKSMDVKKEDAIEKMKLLSSEQNKIRKEANFSSVMHNLKLLQNIEAVMSLRPCIVDYALNVGLKTTSEQWMAFLQENGSFSSNVSLKTVFEDFGLNLPGFGSF
jgi:hypothetical protein